MIQAPPFYDPNDWEPDPLPGCWLPWQRRLWDWSHGTHESGGAWITGNPLGFKQMHGAFWDRDGNEIHYYMDPEGKKFCHYVDRVTGKDHWEEIDSWP